MNPKTETSHATPTSGPNTICAAGARNGYFDALLTPDKFNTTPPLPSLPSLWTHAPHSAPHALTPLSAQLSLCAAQRIATLHEQLLHQHYTCPLIFAPDPPPKATTTATADSQPPPTPTAGLPDPNPHSSTAVVASLDEISTGIEAELRQLSGQVLQQAATLLKSERDNIGAGSAGLQETGLPEDHPKTAVTPDFWLVVSPLIPMLAMYAPQPSLQQFATELISCIAPDALLPSGSPPGKVELSASGSASKVTVARVIAMCLGQGSFLQEPQLQKAWLHAVQLDLSAAVTKLNSATTSSSQPVEPPHRDTSRKRRKSRGMQPGTDAAGVVKMAAEGPIPKRDGVETECDLRQCLMQTLRVVTPFLAAALKPDVALGADGKHGRDICGSSCEASSAGKKRKSAELPFPTEAAQTRPLLRHVTGLLQHVALMPLGMLSAANAASLAQLLLHTQLQLAQTAVALATTAATNVQAGDALRMTTSALVSSQHGMVKCLKGSRAPDAAAAGLLLHAGPQLWHWLPTVVQLVCQTQVFLSLSSVPKLPAAHTPHPQGHSSTLPSTSPQRNLPAGSAKNPGSRAVDASCMVPVHCMSTTMLEEMSASMRCLACSCLGVRQTVGETLTADMAAADCGANDEVVIGFETFVTWLAAELQVWVLF